MGKTGEEIAVESSRQVCPNGNWAAVEASSDTKYKAYVSNDRSLIQTNSPAWWIWQTLGLSMLWTYGKQHVQLTSCSWSWLPCVRSSAEAGRPWGNHQCLQRSTSKPLWKYSRENVCFRDCPPTQITFQHSPGIVDGKMILYYIGLRLMS